MPKTTHEHQKQAINSDRKLRPEDENLYAREKQEFQASQKEKKVEDEKPTEGGIPGEGKRED